MAHKWADWLHHRYHLGGPQPFIVKDKITTVPQVGKLAGLPLPPGGSRLLHSREQNQKWPTSGQSSNIIATVYGVPKPS